MRGKVAFIVYDFYSILSNQKQGFHAFETIQACGTYHRAQVSHRSAEKDASVMEGVPPKADWSMKDIRRVVSKELNNMNRHWNFINAMLCTCPSFGCPAENGMHGTPFRGCSKKLNGLLSTITIRQRSFDRQERSFTCSRYSLSLMQTRGFS